ncbi:MAG TPA: hypothetical protein VHD61_02155 [Lacunisphaera sp.]|nr:hypothetical protein [Lacunisphaera sp.]
MSNDDVRESSDYAAFAILVYEFASDEAAKTNQKIRNALRRKQLGPYDSVRIDRLRALKNELQRELRSGASSLFYRGATSTLGSPEDFDQARLVDDLAVRFPEFTKHDLGRMVSIALYVDYLR